jgi:CHAT domain-containing protein
MYLGVVSAVPAGDLNPTGPTFIEIGGEELDAAQNEWLASSILKKGSAQPALERFWSTIARVIRPALPTGVQKLIVAPDGPLGGLPWHLLQQRLGLPVSTVVSWQHLAELRAPVSVQTRSSQVLLIRGVPYSSDSGFEQLTADDGVESAASTGKLPLTELAGSAATKSNIVAALAKARYAHFQTHGVVQAREDARALSGSYLALAGNAKRNEQSRLTAQELAGIDLRHLRLITLAACQSGEGAVLRGQGVLGLQAAASASGARHALLSLWNVDDEIGALFLSRFYEGLLAQNLTPPAALMRAIRAMQQEKRDSYHWAGWVLLGAE